LKSKKAAAAADPRLAAFQVLGDVARGEFADRAAERRLEGLSPADRALGLELAYGTIRLRARLDAEIEGLLDRPSRRLDPGVIQWLRLGLYQLRETRIPDHASVDQTVGGLKRSIGPGAAGLVNAVLRRAAREGPRPDRFPDPEAEPLEWLATWGSHPEWLVRRWLRLWPLASVRRLVENDNQPPPVTVRVLGDDGLEGPDLTSGEGVRLAREDGWRGMFRIVEGRPDQALRAFPSVVQDPAAAAVVDYVGERLEPPVLDACAAPGGKTVGLAWSAVDARPFVAADVSGARLGRLRDTVRRMGLDVSLLVADARAPAIDRAGTILIDAPCSGTGVLRRRPDARWRIQETGLRSLVALQWQMLDALAERVRPGGMLVYATCSLEPEENEQQVDGFLERFPDFRREPPEGGRLRDGAIDARGDLRVMPWQWGTDGAFASRLRRRKR
jgi:16S rRNA (cytosine967-C5)-methyltransferase